MRPVLRPGATLLRRDATHLQLGTVPGRAVVVPDSPAVRSVLSRLDGVRPRERVLRACPDRAAAASALDALVEAGMVIDADEVRGAAVPAELGHLLARGDPGRARGRLRARVRAGVGLVPARGSSYELLGTVGELLAAAGVGRLVAPDEVAEQVAPGPWRHQLPPGRPRPDAVVVAGAPVTGPDTEYLVLAGIPHLAVSLADGVGVVGPFVRPGQTACVGCVDRAVAARDPAWPALVEQLRPSRIRAADGGLPPPRSRLLECSLASWAVRDVLAHLGDEPVITAGASLRLGDDLVDQVVHHWQLDPGCGCCLLG